MRDDMNKEFDSLMTVIARILAICWNGLMRICTSIGLMPHFKKRPWLLFVLIFLLMAILPPIAIFFAGMGFSACDKCKAGEDFIVDIDFWYKSNK